VRRTNSTHLHCDVEHFIAVAGVGFDEDPFVRIPQPDGLVLPTAQAVVPIGCVV